MFGIRAQSMKKGRNNFRCRGPAGCEIWTSPGIRECYASVFSVQRKSLFG
jgi:hypothetical protein